MGVPITYNLRNLAERRGTTLMTAVGIGLTVAVLVTALALTAGLKSVFGGSGDPRHLIVLRKGVTVVNLPSVDSPEGMNVTVRGMLPIGLSMRPITMVSGKQFESGLRQVI